MLHTGFYRIEPYSTRAILHAYILSVTYLHDLKYGQEIMESALKTHIGNLYLEPFISFVTNSCNLFFCNRAGSVVVKLLDFSIAWIER